MPHIAIRTSEAERWRFAKSTRYPDEAFLRDRIYEEPALIPLSEIGLNIDSSVIALREVGLPVAGSSDVILINSDGDIVIVECKLATNPEKKRTVIGQVLDYASSLSKLSPGDLNVRVEREYHRRLNDLMGERVSNELWEEDQFNLAVSDTLSYGRFKLVIAIDEMDPDLARILHYVSSQGSLRIFGLELRYHKQDGVEVIIPHIANPIEITTVKLAGQKVDWDADAFRAQLVKLTDASEHTATLDLLDFIWRDSDELVYGHGQEGALGFRAGVGNASISIFTYYTTGAIGLNWSSFRAKASSPALETFMDSMAVIHGFETIGVEKSWQKFHTRDTLMDEVSREEFKNAMLMLQGSLR